MGWPTRIRPGGLTVAETEARLHEGLDRWAETVHERIDAFEEQAAESE